MTFYDNTEEPEDTGIDAGSGEVDENAGGSDVALSEDEFDHVQDNESEDDSAGDGAGDDSAGDGEGEEEGEPKEPVFSDNLLRRAGMPESQVRAFGIETPQELERFILFQDRGIGQGRGEAVQQEEQQAADDTAKQAEEDAKFQPIKVEGLEDFDETGKTALSGLADSFNSVLSKQHNQIQELQNQLGQFAQVGQDQQANAFFSSVDDAIASLDSADIYGKDSVATPSEGPGEDMLQEVMATMEVDQKMGRQSRSVEDIVANIHNRIHGSTTEEKTTKRLTKQARDGRQRFTSKPTRRKGKGLTKTESAVRAVSDAYKERGFDQDEDDVEEEFGSG